MTNGDLSDAECEALIQEEGYKTYIYHAYNYKKNNEQCS